MKFLRRFLNQLEGPPHIDGGGDDMTEVDEDLGEEMPDAAEDVESLKRAEMGTMSGTMRIRSGEPTLEPDIGPFEDAEHAHDEPERATGDATS